MLLITTDIWTERSAVLLCHLDVYSMIISKLILAKFSLTSHFSHLKILESCLITVCVLWSWFLFAIVLCVCARPRVCEGERVWVFFVCLFCMPCVEWVWVFLVLLFYVIYSRTIASIANVFCWLYLTLNKVYLILSYLILSYLTRVLNQDININIIYRVVVTLYNIAHVRVCVRVDLLWRRRRLQW